MKAITATSVMALTWACGAMALTPSQASAQTTPAAKPTTTVQEVVVTAQKREQKIQSVGMSIQAVSGDILLNKGVNSLGDLTKLVPGLRAADTGFRGPPGVSIRGVGYEDASLAANPTVTIYNDQAPLPFSIEGLGSTLDLQRVEVLKGPQGTLFGDNSTGGAINYIANKPTDHFEAGTAIQYGTFNTLDAQGYLSGPLTSTLGARLALRTVQADGYQKNYINGATLGARNFTTGRLTLEWKPTDRLTIVGALSGFVDLSQTPSPQFEGFSPLSPTALPVAGVIHFPIAPSNARATAFPTCINDSPNDTHCVGYNRNNRFYLASLRGDYDLGGGVTLTSLTSYENYVEYQPLSQDGTTYQDYQSITGGHLTTFYQELRLSGNFSGKGAWILGGNYQNDNTAESDYATVADSSSADVLGIPVTGLHTTVAGVTNTYALFVHAEYPLLDNVTLEGGVRGTRSDQNFTGCLRDDGNGLAATAIQYLQNYLITGGPVGPGVNLGPGGCVTLGPGTPISVNPGPPLVVTPGSGYVPGLVHDSLDESNISFRFGANWKVTHEALLYANVSQGYKAGSFAGLSATNSSSYAPAHQERLVAFETGFKSDLFDRALQLDGAAFYYDYTDKQIQGSVLDPLFGDLPKLINIPQSHIVGFELSAIWRPLAGLTLTPSVSYAQSRIDGNFYNYDPLGNYVKLSGHQFPGEPELQADVDAEYDWRVSDDLHAFVGANANHQGHNNSEVGSVPQLNVPAYTLLDLRGGLERGPLRVELWARNALNTYYWTAQLHVVDAFTRYAGMPATYGVTLSYKYR